MIYAPNNHENQFKYHRIVSANEFMWTAKFWYYNQRTFKHSKCSFVSLLNVYSIDLMYLLTYTTQMNIFSSFLHKYSIKKGNHKKKECFKNYIKTNRRCLCSLSLLEFLCKYHISYLRFTGEERKKKKWENSVEDGHWANNLPATHPK